MTICLQARYVFPIGSAPISNGTVTVQGDRIVDLRPRAPGAKTIHLGSVAILPGLVNAHTHLEFSDLREPLRGCESSFASWLQTVVQYRRRQLSDQACDCLAPLHHGGSECVEAGTALLGEIATRQWGADESLPAGLPCVVFRELMGSRAEHVMPQLAVAREHIAAGRQATGWRAGISPHAPYTTSPELVQRVVELSAETHTPVAMHLAESAEEVELLAAHSGPLVRLLRDLDAWTPDAVPRGMAAGDYLRVLAGAHRVLIVHGNYLARQDWDFLAVHGDRMSVVFCPRTHAQFGHRPYALSEMLQRGVRVCLGTDSRASNPDLDLFGELRQVARNHASVPPSEILRLGTLSGAQALGLDHEFGSLAAGKRANLLALPLADHPSRDPYELVLLADETPKWIMRDGRLLSSC